VAAHKLLFYEKPTKVSLISARVLSELSGE
jgi:hypothetical protein